MRLRLIGLLLATLGAYGTWQFGAQSFAFVLGNQATVTVVGPCAVQRVAGVFAQPTCTADWVAAGTDHGWRGRLVGAPAGGLGQRVDAYLVGDVAYAWRPDPPFWLGLIAVPMVAAGLVLLLRPRSRRGRTGRHHRDYQPDWGYQVVGPMAGGEGAADHYGRHDGGGTGGDSGGGWSGAGDSGGGWSGGGGDGGGWSGGGGGDGGGWSGGGGGGGDGGGGGGGDGGGGGGY